MSVSEKELTNHARAGADVQFQLTTTYFCDILLLVGLGSPGFKRLIPCPLNKHSRGEKLDVRSFQMA